jgi:hypothetical protein
MNRVVMMAIVNTFAKSILLATMIAVVIGIIGYINQWDTSLVYSNAFFIAGALAIIAGTSSRLAAADRQHRATNDSARRFSVVTTGWRRSTGR